MVQVSGLRIWLLLVSFHEVFATLDSFIKHGYMYFVLRISLNLFNLNTILTILVLTPPSIKSPSNLHFAVYFLSFVIYQSFQCIHTIVYCAVRFLNYFFCLRLQHDSQYRELDISFLGVVIFANSLVRIMYLLSPWFRSLYIVYKSGVPELNKIIFGCFIIVPYKIWNLYRVQITTFYFNFSMDSPSPATNRKLIVYFVRDHIIAKDTLSVRSVSEFNYCKIPELPFIKSYSASLVCYVVIRCFSLRIIIGILCF